MTDRDRILWAPGDVTIRPPTEDELNSLGVVTEPAPALPSGLDDPARRLTGEELFAAKSKAEQDAAVGSEAAEKIRRGELSLSDLVQRSRIATAEDFITQRPLKRL